MAKQVINAFNSGEVAPSTYARYDQALYNTACLKMENFVPLQTGGADRRPGTQYLADLDTNKSVAYSFVFNNSNTYVLVFSNLELKIYDKDGTFIEAFTTTYLEAEIYDIKLTQSADVVFIAHPNHPVQKLSRLAVDDFNLEQLTYSFPPTIDLNEDLTFSVSESLKSETITHVTITDSGASAVFTVASHSFVIGSKVNVVNVTTSSNASDFVKTNGTWEITATTSTTITCTIHDDNVTARSIQAVADNSATIREFRTSIPANTTITLTASQDFFTSDHVGSEFILQQKRDNANSLVDSTKMYPLANASKADAAGIISRNGYSDSLNASLSNWSIETLGFWRGKVIIQRSLDNGVTYEDYVVVGDTSGLLMTDGVGTGDEAVVLDFPRKNFTFSSTEPEPANSLLRVVTSFFSKNYENVDTPGADKFGFILKTENPYILAPCTINTVTSATQATAVLNAPLIDAVNDYESNTGNCKWVTGKNYFKHDKVKFSGELIELTDGVPEQLVKNDGSTPLAGVQGACWDADNDRLLVLTDESGTFKVYAFSGTSLAHDGTDITGNKTADATVITLATANASSFYDTYKPSDIAWYDGHIYTWGTMFPQGNHKNGTSGTQMNRKQLSKFNVDGSHESAIAGNDEKNTSLQRGVNQTFGLGFDGSHFYAAYSFFDENQVSGSGDTITYKLKVRKYNTSGGIVSTYTKATQTVSIDPTSNEGINQSGWNSGTSSQQYNWNTEFLDITAKDGLLYILNNNDDEINLYDTSCNFLTTAVNLTTDDYRGIGYNPQTQTFYSVEDDGFAQGYSIADTVTSYYQCQVEHTSSNFGTALDLGYWVERFPNKVEFYESAFNKRKGFPHSVAIYESRLCFGGTDSNPNTIWLSKSNDLNNFAVGVNANDSMRLTINSNTIDEIRWLCPSTSLIIGTSANEWALGSGSDQLAITPTQLNIKRQSNYGSNKIQGELVNASILFFMRQGTKLREWIQQNTANVFLASDLASYAEQATAGGILQMAVQTQPETIIWMIRNDGQLIGLTYEKETKTFGWHRHTFNGATAESVTVLPTSTGEDSVYIVLKKTSDNKRCLVKMDDRDWGSTYTTEYPGLDLYKKYTSHSSATVSGLDHLEGKSVIAKVNGVTQTKTVSSNAITLDSTPSNATVYVGLSYTSTLAPLYLGLEYKSGTTRGDKVGVKSAMIRFDETLSAKVGQTETASDLQAIEFASTSSLNSEDVPCYLSNANEFLQTVYVIQDEPQPCTVLGMVINLDIGRGNT